jgi:3-methylcrotonyl-CoA carboxylase alpha subunit
MKFNSKSSKQIKTLAVANRGEVAVRIIRACDELGIDALLLHSEADQQSLAYRIAKKRICIGASPVNESYLNIEAVIEGAKAGGAEAIHPGFGFLSEDAHFVEKVEASDLIFVGPSAQAMRSLGDKVSCKQAAKKLGVPLVPGYEGEDQSPEFLLQKAKEIGFPVVVKAAHGGGGRGMKVLRQEQGALELILSSKRESMGAFGSDKIFLEKYLDQAKHIEVQVFADASGRVVHLFDRECSVQRKHQKIIEEAISTALTPHLRQKLFQASCLLVESVGYQNAATVEFLVQGEDFYLLEVNTRLQVEHPVTEEVLGIDLVKAQILTAMGQPVFSDQDILVPRGHSIECRLYAEDPFLGGVPSTGRLGTIQFPFGPHRRFDYGFEAGDEITSFYDPMIAKLIVWDETRPRAIQKMLRVLDETIVFGVQTNIPLLKKILSHPEFVSGEMTTQFFNQHFAEPLPSLQKTEEWDKIINLAKAQTYKSQAEDVGAVGTVVAANERKDPFTQAWRTP